MKRLGTKTIVTLVALLAGSTLTATLFWEARKASVTELESLFHEQAAALISLITETLNNRIRDLESVGRFYGASQFVDRGEFRRFVEPVVRTGGIQAMEWIPRVSHALRAAYEASARRDGLEAFEIKEMDVQGRLQRSGIRPEYYPVYFVEPLHGNEAAVGFDLSSNPARLATLEQARDTGEPRATERITLVQETGNQFGFLVFVPVYEPGEPLISYEQRRRNLNGFALGVFRICDMVEQSLRMATTKGLEVRLCDTSSLPEQQILYARECELRFGKADIISPEPLVKRLQYGRKFSFAGRVWLMEIQADKTFLTQNVRHTFWLILPIGFVITLLLSLYFYNLYSRHEHTEAAVKARTGELEQQKLELDTILENAPAIMILVDEQVRVVRTNRAATLLTGSHPDDLVGLLGGQALHCINAFKGSGCGRNRECELCIIRTTASEAFRRESTIREREGRICLEVSGQCVERQALVSASPIMTEKVRRVLLTIEDITERKRIEGVLKEHLHFLQVVVDAIPSPLFIKDRHEVYTGCNKAFSGFIGLPMEMIIGKTVFDLAPPDLAAIYHEKDQELLSNPGVQKYEERVKYADGTLRQVIFHKATFGALDGSLGGMVGVILDITDLKRAEEALRQSEERFRQIVESASDAIYSSDEAGRFTFMNRVGLKITGYTEEALLRMSYLDLLRPDVLEQLKGFYAQQMLEKVANTYIELPIITKNGQEVWIGQNVQLLTTDGKVTGFQAVARNITERIRAEERLLAAKREVEETNQKLEEAIERANLMALRAEMASIAKSEFLANMSHEIRTPLNGVIGMTGLLLETELTADQREYASVARTSGEALLSLIKDILDFSRIEARKLELESIDFDLRTTLGEAVDMLASKAHEKGLKLECLIQPEAPSLLRGDPGRLRQVLMNLVGNSVKFTREGRVTIHVSLKTEDQQKATVLFQIIDTGIGVPKDQIEDIFSPFTQADGSTTRLFGGTGLGLSISKQLVEMMGGSIGVESPAPGDCRGESGSKMRNPVDPASRTTDPGSSVFRVSRLGGPGSVFWFTAVFEKQPEGIAGRKGADTGLEEIPHGIGTEPVLMKRAMAEGEKTKVRILLAEDNATNQEVALAMMKKLGYQADVASTGREAVEALKRSPYDLVLMDCQMPEMDGYTATRAIRDGEEKAKEMIGLATETSRLTPHVPIIAMTAHAMQGDSEKCAKAGMDDYIPKPVTLQALGEMLEKWLTKESRGWRLENREEEAENRKPEPGTSKGEDPVSSLDHPVSDPEIFDRKEFFIRLMGDSHLAKAVTEKFLEDIPRQIRILKDMLGRGDEAGAQRQSHTIKGAAANVGGTALSALAYEMEKAGKAGELEKLAELMPELDKQFDTLRKAMAGDPNLFPEGSGQE